jgi:hypothetical protein
VEVAARPCSVKKAVTVRYEAFCSSSHAATGEAAIPIKSAKDNIAGTVCMRMIALEHATALRLVGDLDAVFINPEGRRP